MYNVYLLEVKSGKEFTKVFDSPYLMNKFVNKCKRGTKLKVVGITKNY